MYFNLLKPGFPQRVFDEANEGQGGSGGDTNAPGPAAQPQSNSGGDRMSAMESRLGQLTNILGQVVQSTQTREAQSKQERDLATAQGFVTEAQTRLQAAQRKLTAAHENGDASAIAEATAEVSTAAAEHTAARMHAETKRAEAARAASQPATPQRQQPAQQQQPQPHKVDDSNLRNWRDRNKDWYGIDSELTQAALDVAKRVEQEGVLEVGSQGYFQAIDARLRNTYPDRMPRNTGAGNMQTPRGDMTTSPAPSNSRIPSHVADGYRRMGINVDDPAIAKKMVEARETAVQKGFLPSQPSNERVVTR